MLRTSATTRSLGQQPKTDSVTEGLCFQNCLWGMDGGRRLASAGRWPLAAVQGRVSALALALALTEGLAEGLAEGLGWAEGVPSRAAGGSRGVKPLLANRGPAESAVLTKGGLARFRAATKVASPALVSASGSSC
jgi:hypothetical protein